jgi:uncharacterized membrane protein YpjA
MRLPSWPKSRNMQIFLWVLIIANLIGAAIGYIFWYGDQLLSTPWYLWIITPDCPLAATLFVVSLLLIRKGVKAAWFYFITAVWLLKYGLWTIFVYVHILITTVDTTGLFMFMTFVMVMVILSHIAMMIEGYWLASFACQLKRAWLMIPASALLFFVNDYFDYYSTTLTTLPRDANVGLYAAVAMFGTIVFPFIVYWSRNKATKFIKKIYH